MHRKFWRMAISGVSTWACWCMGRVFPQSWRWVRLCPSQRSSPPWGRAPRRRCRPSRRTRWLQASQAWRMSPTRQRVPLRILATTSPIKSWQRYLWYENGEGEAKAGKEHTSRESSLSSDFWVVQHKQVERICRDLNSSTGESVDVKATWHTATWMILG